MILLLMLLGCIKELKNEVIYKGKGDLIKAAEEGNIENILDLLSKGEGINETDSNGRTPLYQASFNGHKEVVELLITKGAEIDKEVDGRTALSGASFNGHKEVVELLITKGAEIDKVGGIFGTALYVASLKGCKGVVELLLRKGAEIDKVGGIFGTALSGASYNGHKEIVELLITKGAEIDKEVDGRTALYVASLNGRKEVVELLITKGAEIDKEVDERTALYVASCNGHKEVVELLLTNGAEIDKGEITALYVASLKGHKEVVELLLSKGSVDKEGRYGTALYGAIREGHTEVVELFITKGAKIDKGEITALYVASLNGRKEVVELLITKGEEIDKEVCGRTALYLASFNGHKEVVELLITKGAEIDKEVDGRTALYLASEKGHKEVVELLIIKGAEIDKEVDGRTALYLASEKGHKEVVELLLAKGAKIDKEVDGRTALYLASENGHKEVVEMLLSKGAEIDKGGRTALHVASCNGHKEVVELLLTKGAEIDKVRGKYGTALSGASSQGHKEVVELLITKGAEIDKGKRTALYLASLQGRKEVVELLITKGAEIDKVVIDGTTPLMIASENSHKEVVELLITKGAEIDKEVDGRTALYVASANGHKEVVKLLLTKGAEIDKGEITALSGASKNGHKEVVKLLITKGAEINKGHITALYGASLQGHKEVVELLITKGAEIDKGEIIALYVASLQGHKEVVKLLLSKGAAIDLIDKEGRTALYGASSNGHKEVVELLLTKGASIDLTNKDGKTPLYIASQNGHKEVSQLLVKHGAKVEKFSSNFKYKKADLIKDILTKCVEWNDSCCCFTSNIFLKEENIDTYLSLANYLSFQYLSENFFLISDMNYYGYNSLHFAVMQDSTNSLKKLLSDDNIFAFVNSYDNREKETCLALAFRLNKLEHVKILLSFLASPIYFKYSLLNKKQINVLDILEIREYASNAMIFDVLKDGRPKNAEELLFGHVKESSSLESKINSFSYKDIINLAAFDLEGKNVFHYLAIYSHDEMDLSHFFAKSFLLPSFSQELLYVYDMFGMTPFHYALLNSNEEFVKYFLRVEDLQREEINEGVNIEQRSLLKKQDLIRNTGKKENISDLIMRKSFSRGIINLLIKYVWGVNEGNEYDFISNKEKKTSEKCILIESKIAELRENELIYSILKSDDKELLIFFLEKVNLKDESIREEESLLNIASLAIRLNAFNCLQKIFSRVQEEDKIERFFRFEDLFQICQEDKVEVIEVLAKVRENKLLIRDGEGNTLLHFACSKNKEEIVKKLIEYKSMQENINEKNREGNTAMHKAHVALSPSLIDIIKKAGADINIKNNSEKRAIDLLSDLLKEATVESKQEGIKIGTIYSALCALLGKEYDAEYKCVLHLAVLAEEDWVIRQPCTKGLINEIDEEGNTALHLAIKADRKDDVKALIERGSSLSIRNKLGESAVDLMSSRAVVFTVLKGALNKNITSEYLLNVQNKEGNTILHLAVERAKIKEREVEIETTEGKIEKRKVEEIDLKDRDLIKTLLDNGANKDKLNNNARTPVDIANARSPVLLEFLMGYEPLLPLMRSREGRYFQEKAEQSRKKGVDENEEREVIEILNGKRKHDEKLCTGRMAIHVVVERDDDYALRILLEKGSKPEWQDLKGNNAYKIAINKGSIEAFKLLVDREGLEGIKRESKDGSAIFMVLNKDISFLGGKFFDVIFNKLEEEYKKNNFSANELRQMKQDPITKIMQRDDKEMLEKMIEIGLGIIDNENNLLHGAISRKSKKIFKYLLSKVGKEAILSVKNKERRTLTEEAEIINSSDKDDFYVKKIKKRLDELES